MSDIVLSASVRQNLLSLQSTADLLATTQNRLATGKKVNSALDNPTNYFTAQGLDSRASDINNLLDSIGNGVQVLQQANNGITSLQKLVDTAKSIANQALQATSGYSTKSQGVTKTLGTTVSAANLFGTAADTDATAGSVTAGAFTAVNVSGDGSDTSAVATGTSALASLTIGGVSGTDDFKFDVNGTTVTLAAGTTYTATQIKDAIQAVSATSKVDASLDADGHLVLTSTAGAGASDSVTIDNFVTTATGGNLDGTALGFAASPAVANGADGSGNADSVSFDIAVDGAAATTVTIDSDAVDDYNTNSGAAALDASKLSAADVAKLVNYQVGSDVASVSTDTATAGRLVFKSTTTGADSSIEISNFDASQVTSGSTGVADTPATTAGATGSDIVPGSALKGQTLTIGSTGGGQALTINFGSSGDFSYDEGTGIATNVSSLDQLNTVLAHNNMSASLSTDGKLTFTTTNDFASSTIGAFGGTAVDATTGAFGVVTASPPVKNADAQNDRAALIKQYNDVIDQIRTTAQDASFNGVNLLNGDQLKLVFNETGSSTLNIQGVTFDPAGLGLSSLTKGVDFLDNTSTNKVLDSLSKASSTLRSQASTLGSNLSIVQIRQDFNKNLINVLQTGSSNLTLADTNEEAANSQALSTRQSIAVSALALANQSQQSVLQLLR